MMRWALLLLAGAGLAQPYASPAKKKPTGGMPFMESMVYRALDVNVTAPAGPMEAGVRVALKIHRGMGRPREYEAKTDAKGVAHFARVPTNKMLQGGIRYELTVDHQGVRFPFQLEGVPGENATVDIQVPEVTTDISSVSVVHNIDLLPDEDSLVVRHRFNLYNNSDLVVKLGAQPAGGLKLPCPDGAKHPELHDDHDPTMEVRGAAVFYTGALMPRANGPRIVSFVYTIPYDSSNLEWSQTLPIGTGGVSVATPLDKLEGMRDAVPMKLHTRGGFGSVTEVKDGGGERTFAVLRSEGATLKPGEALRFAVSGLPALSRTPFMLVGGGIVAVFGLVLFGFRADQRGPRHSKAHLVDERDRLVRALARMRKAVAKGKLSESRFEREREAITARLVSLYKALDRLDAR